MIRGFYTAGSGLVSQQSAIDNAANNLANLNTAGFKKQRVSFSELLYNNLGTAEGNQPQNLKVGNGSRASQVASIHTQGNLQETNNPLDFALISQGFFAVRSPDGSTRYTRDGSFQVSMEADGRYLVTSGGDYVLGWDGNKLSAEADDILGQIGIFRFDNPNGLSRAGDNIYLSTAASGQPMVSDGYLVNGYLESSNVDLTDEMADLIAVQKAYQFNAKLVQTADEIENITNNLR